MVQALHRPRPPSSSPCPTFLTAYAAWTAGISVVPIRADGTKRPALASWKVYQQRRPQPSELDRWFRTRDVDIAFITGAVSGNLEALDFDDAATYQVWLTRLTSDPLLHRLSTHLTSGYEEVTPAGGRHLLYRCSEIGGNQKLASRLVGTNERRALIETRGEGGLLIVSPSCGPVHPSGKSYRLLRGGVLSIKTITPDERQRLLAACRAFDELPRQVSRPRSPKPPHPSDATDVRPGDVLNQHATWEEILEPHGWELVRCIGGKGEWRRPGKHGPGISATTNWDGSGLLYVFSTSTAFEPERGYSKFSAYTLLNHDGDYTHAMRNELTSSKRV